MSDDNGEAWIKDPQWIIRDDNIWISASLKLFPILGQPNHPYIQYRPQHIRIKKMNDPHVASLPTKLVVTCETIFSYAVLTRGIAKLAAASDTEIRDQLQKKRKHQVVYAPGPSTLFRWADLVLPLLSFPGRWGEAARPFYERVLWIEQFASSADPIDLCDLLTTCRTGVISLQRTWGRNLGDSTLGHRDK